MRFDELRSKCEFLTYQDGKCVNEKNKLYRMVNGCGYEFCPRKSELTEKKIGKQMRETKIENAEINNAHENKSDKE